jgi:hypothetical protein
MIGSRRDCNDNQHMMLLVLLDNSKDLEDDLSTLENGVLLEYVQRRNNPS